jgi:hypothetical protein
MRVRIRRFTKPADIGDIVLSLSHDSCIWQDGRVGET